MKGIYLIAIATVFLASWSAIAAEVEEFGKIPTKCPAKDPKNTTIHLAHETDCTKFYTCQAGKKILQKCPKMNKEGDRLHFNPRLQVCDWPQKAGCRYKDSGKDQAKAEDVQFVPVEELHESTFKCKIPTKCPAKDPKNTTIHLAHERDCTKFYKCQAGKKILQQCAKMNKKGDRLHFNPCLQVCDWPQTAGCEYKDSDEDHAKAENEQFVPVEELHESTLKCKIPTKCPAKDPKNTTIHLAHETDCTKFYKCQAGKKILQQCAKMNKKGDRLHFNPCLQVCDWPQNAGCKYKKSDGDQAEAMNEEFISKVNHKRVARMVNARNECPDRNPGNTTILLPHDYDCTKFYMCLGSEKVEQVCPYMNEEGDRLHFNPRTNVCDWPNNAGCEGEDLDNDVPSITDDDEENEEIRKIPTKCPAKDPKHTTIHLAHEYDCTKFYMCQAGRKILRKCPYMDKNGNRLHFNPRLQVCDWPEHAGCRSSPPGDDCPKGSDGLLLPHQCNCAMFYECVKGDKVLRECADGLYFSKKYQGCVKIEDSDCRRKEPPPKCTRNGELIPHECDCGKYYKCRKDDKVLQWCDEGLHFSPTRRKCEDPDKAGCKDPDKPIGPGDCPNSKDPWRHECDCRLFYKCENGKKRLYECPWGYYYNPKYDTCSPQEQVKDCKNHNDRND
ncbi:PREDICTED: uncharacterized protein LOC106749556 [Dinoponera quadriceps]|uniref:Uncharacterized protein LOC106749556 n=1 Tax=Dinoponera quadriceps TaxID=609295 RepID=A0A6P3Y2Y3_DINQU|nr:PREDICTED: uncharacterized protein LOC106749556 [Dinoponera quadriceps]